ncbi:hypothetical protein CA54_21660 [Symmachiella macrocystis]|uniref:Sialate O-acetylesterase domain-containing protein n=1 Tax=Symmachiella macrocystis TaxID=2527985 RepID=A0A5C6BPK9_9PLAN|nr:sialate O-acetylesterase [Symmachiella macrocystis]TWU13331.1 hypothetical protein CA54_21660 [Symmachiella macrocystis]
MHLFLRSSYVLSLPILAVSLASVGYSEELQRPDAGKKIKVFLFAGQSNMEGRASGCKITQEDRTRLKNVQKRIQLAFNHEPISPLKVVSPSEEIRKIYQRDRIFGPELFFGISLAEAMPNEKFLFIKRTRGSSSLHGCWNPEWSEDKAVLLGEAKHPKLYREYVDYVRQVLDGYSPEDYELCAMLWVQGESDDKAPEAEAAYGATLRKLIERVRLDTKHSTLPFILFQVGSPKVVEGMRQTAAKVPSATLIPQSLNPDSSDFYEKMENGHYNAEGMKKLGTRFAEVFLRTYAPPRQ